LRSDKCLAIAEADFELAILLSQPPEPLGLQACATAPSNSTGFPVLLENCSVLSPHPV
uniref:Uncharacterized protein n=1 Tax=Spermophilus dauricus TaxID=99837 RepID=A0A8C9P2W7_SPEDA